MLETTANCLHLVILACRIAQQQTPLWSRFEMLDQTDHLFREAEDVARSSLMYI